MSEALRASDAPTPAGGRQRSGRWRSGARSRQRILDAARRRFARHGYAGATVRGIATDAGVDAAMVFYFFGSKQALFSAAMQLPGSLPGRLAAVLAGGLGDAGTGIVRMFLEELDAAGDHETLVVLTRAAPTHDTSAAMLRDFVDREFADPIAEAIDTADARLRVGLVATQLLGLAVTRYLVRLEPVASASRDELVTRLGPLVQQCLTGNVDPTSRLPSPPG